MPPNVFPRHPSALHHLSPAFPPRIFPDRNAAGHLVAAKLAAGHLVAAEPATGRLVAAERQREAAIQPEASKIQSKGPPEERGLEDINDVSKWMVLALPRGGVPVGYEVARALHAPLDVIVVRKLRAPAHPELALGALASCGDPAQDPIRVLNEAVLRSEHIPPETLLALTRTEQTELQRREKRFRGSRPPLQLTGKTVVLVDDGAATGATLEAALRAVGVQRPARLIVAIPTLPEATLKRLAPLADLCIALQTPDPFYSVGQWYRDFTQIQDAEVLDWLEKNQRECAARPSTATA
jgi:putative phosphoribosyl transferase